MGVDRLDLWMACVGGCHVAGCVRGADQCPAVYFCFPWFPGAWTWVWPWRSYWTMGTPSSTETRDGVRRPPPLVRSMFPRSVVPTGCSRVAAGGSRPACTYSSFFFSSTTPPRCVDDPAPPHLSRHDLDDGRPGAARARARAAAAVPPLLIPGAPTLVAPPLATRSDWRTAPRSDWWAGAQPPHGPAGGGQSACLSAPLPPPPSFNIGRVDTAPAASR